MASESASYSSMKGKMAAESASGEQNGSRIGIMQQNTAKCKKKAMDLAAKRGLDRFCPT